MRGGGRDGSQGAAWLTWATGRALGSAFALAVLVTPLAAAVDFSTLDGKVLFGYQGWFHCTSSGGPWTHWSRGNPTPSTLTVDMYPDLSEFKVEELCPVAGMTLGGKPAYLFSSQSPVIVDAHFRWMKEYGLDGVLVQRFIGATGRMRSGGDVVLRNVMAAAAAHGRTFAIEYDVSGGADSNFASLIQADWAYLVDGVRATSHPNYLRHQGRPVVSVWGMGLSEERPPSAPGPAQALVDWFKSGAAERYRVTYMGGTPSQWRSLSGDARPDSAWKAVYRSMDVVQPWTIGRYADLPGADAWRRTRIAGDLALRKGEGKLYMPVIFPGFSWFNLKEGARPNQIPRLGGRFLWRQAYNAKAAGATLLKIAMFDEVDESTAMFKLAPTRADAPDQGYWLTLDADGERLPSDWYLRLAGEITRMFRGTRPADSAMPANPRGPIASGVPTPAAGGRGSGGMSIRKVRGGVEAFLPAEAGGTGEVRIHSSAGRLLRTLAFRGGRVFWDGRDAGGALLPPGIYLLRAGPGLPGAETIRVAMP